MALLDHMINQKLYISTTTIPMVTKLVGVMTYFEEFLPIKSHDPLMTVFRNNVETKSFIPHFHNANGNKTKQGGDLP